MLHDSSHITPPELVKKIILEACEIDVLKNLAEERDNIAAFPVHQEKAGLWQKLNDLAFVILKSA